ncbi:type II toxin-antitoxin system RelE/ParE family toxin [Rhizobium sp. SSA_523]|uniref:type II toxin-antitoxin system RelE/ParE family toxin n=1 Tax=Rhizobium sp. SSA_523 TaxID=2952477 RepID=UPI0020912FA7|nr:type II toxin-antitoxin system RelE/ParE family toxin [Rhizobium sp. SSA_523]MCO5733631.1 type II toxin-antitoxin system RelE/ParE family toxin [Rhizobium sp. SSA_523]WKC23073.1 type II toxin-antitoxin system RelE/ParE family toxin [Rhizobium sp. SSA_523]
MVYKINLAAAVSADFDQLFDHLFAVYLGTGDSIEEAYDRATNRVNDVARDVEKLAFHPHRGTLNSDLRPGLRHITKDRAIFYFWIDEQNRVVNVLAVFFGGQDHRRHMLERLNKPTMNA